MQRRSEQPSALMRSAVWGRLFEPVDIASLVYFRIAFGVIMLWEAFRFIDHDWAGRFFSGKSYYFKFWPFDFVHPLPGDGMTIQIYLMGLVAVLVIFGLYYRVSATLLFFMISYIFLIEKARYLNHLYLVCLIAFLTALVPAHRSFSLDTLRRPEFRSSTAPAWAVWLLRFQVGIPYFFGGIAKINSDWLRGEPLRAWLAARTDFPFLGAYFTNEWIVWIMVYGSLILDTFVAFAMLHRKTRVFGYFGVLCFHFMNSRMFSIGIFPWTMIVATAIFFEPDWPRRVLVDLKRIHPFRTPALILGFILGFCLGGFLPDNFSWVRALIGGVGVAIAAYHLDEPFRGSKRDVIDGSGSRFREGREPGRGFGERGVSFAQKGVLVFLWFWVSLQILIPLRHFVIPGNVHWTEEGHNYSWHMKLRDKESEGYFVISDPVSEDEWEIDPWDHLTDRQARKMCSRPEMVVAFARHLKDRMRAKGHRYVEVRAHIDASLNGREYQPLIDWRVDLTRVPYPWFGHAEWILPLKERLPGWE